MKLTRHLLASAVYLFLAMPAVGQVATAPPAIRVDVAEVEADVLVPDVDVAKPTAQPKQDDKSATPAAAAAEGAQRDPEAIQLNLMDGSIITGKLSVKEIVVETKFGNLNIPVESIRSFKPGLDSYPTLGQEVSTLIENLGSEDYSERESARKALAKMGLPIQAELKQHLNDENTERVRHIKAILEEFENLASFEEDSPAAKEKAWLRQDMVETTDFTVVGKINPKSFQVASQYGPLTIQLGHIRNAQRETGAKEDVRKALTVEGTNLAQLSFKNSAIRLEKGDQVSVTASGSIIMSPWGSNSVATPDGSPNFGVYQGNDIHGGALVAKIGDSGTVFKVGSKNTFTADRTGTLQFAIAMQHEYAQGNYQFPGKYDLKIKVQPK